MLFTGFTHVVAVIKISFLFMNNIPVYVYNTCLSIQWLMDIWVVLTCGYGK